LYKVMCEALGEELEVLESIFSSELTRTGERDIQIMIQPDVSSDTREQDPHLLLILSYPTDYPQNLPEMRIQVDKGKMDDFEINSLQSSLASTAEESLGMVMTFSLVSNLKENLDALIRDRIEAAKRKERETERQALLEEEMRLRGTLVTKESFVRWRHDFLKAYKTEQERNDDNKMKGLGQKEREEIKRVALRHTGRQLFERDRNLDASDAAADYVEEGTESVDFSKYQRQARNEVELETTELHLSDSD